MSGQICPLLSQAYQLRSPAAGPSESIRRFSDNHIWSSALLPEPTPGVADAGEITYAIVQVLEASVRRKLPTRRLRQWMRRFNGVTTKYLDNSLRWHVFSEATKDIASRAARHRLLLDACAA